MADDSGFSAREREIVDIVFRLGDATASQVIEQMRDPPSRSAVRTFLRILEDKGHLRHSTRGREYVYRTTKSRSRTGQRAVLHVIRTFFEGSMSNAMASYLADPSADLSANELRELAKLIEQARRKEKQE